VIDKHHFSGFFDTKLQQVLKKLNIKALIVVGLQAHICIAHTIADAYQWGYEITIPKDGICSFSKEIYRHSLKYFQKTYGAKITTIDTIIKSL
jgi:nicotinamidase-related amidase